MSTVSPTVTPGYTLLYRPASRATHAKLALIESYSPLGGQVVTCVLGCVKLIANTQDTDGKMEPLSRFSVPELTETCIAMHYIP